MGNIIDIIIIVSAVVLAWRGKQINAVQIILVGIFTAPVFTLGQYKIAFSYISLVGLLFYMITAAKCIKIPYNDKVLLIAFMLLLIPSVKLLSTLFSVLSGTNSHITWTPFVGELKNIILGWSIAIVLYNGIRKKGILIKKRC